MLQINYGLFLEVFCKGHGPNNFKIHIRLGLLGMKTHKTIYIYILNCLPSSRTTIHKFIKVKPLKNITNALKK
jgi:hypothetical protein